ncbi:MAG: hypothetical protein CMA78_01260 [Euryarchaeota archaeon]|nr:hypothetical protein [Euryarchaeota archaeon]|tara:strand:+ start:15627 stop:15827 length:201 start_codon:yes stop_codon:yes gene_type:complete
METEQVLQAILILTAFLMVFFIIGRFTGSSSSVEKEYSGVARSPEELYEPTEEAISEMESLISKLN